MLKHEIVEGMILNIIYLFIVTGLTTNLGSRLCSTRLDFWATLL